jgi:quinoprotein dehydrogenase-associated probable ABC transporter substrate-binding protein
MPAWAAKLALSGLFLSAVLGTAPQATAQTSDLVSQSRFRVCADPANMPFSSKEETGFENKIAELLAAKLDRPVEYTWFPQALGFVRRTLIANRCDVIIGFAQGHDLVLNSNHYYTSSYVIVTKPDSPLAGVDRISDPALQGKRIGVMAGAPPATHMARNGLIGNAKGYRLMVDRRVESPAEIAMSDLESGEIDAAILWGPIGGYFAKQKGLIATPLLHEEGAPRMFYRITLGMRQGELKWKRELNSLIRRNQAEIDAILTEFGVPLIDDQGTALKAAQ